MFVKNPGLPKPKPASTTTRDGSSTQGIDVVCDQPPQKKDEPKPEEAGGWRDGTMS